MKILFFCVIYNAIAYRDYSRQQIIEIRKYFDYIEFESPGCFPEGIKLKKQEKARQSEAILRYLDSVDTITNAEARSLLVLPDKDISYVSRLLASLLRKGEIELAPNSKPNRPVYKRKIKSE